MSSSKFLDDRKFTIDRLLFARARKTIDAALYAHTILLFFLFYDWPSFGHALVHPKAVFTARGPISDLVCLSFGVNCINAVCF